MREIFSAQPLRQFAHASLLFGTQLQLWVCDPSGPYSADYMEVGENPERLVYVIAAYMLLSDQEHGLDSVTQREKGRTSVSVYDADTKKIRKIYLWSKLLIKQMAIVSRGSTVDISSDAKFVVKVSWRAVGRLSEVEFLMRAHTVKGVAKLIRSRDYDKISDLRSGLTFTKGMSKDIHPLEIKKTTAGNPLQSGSSNPDGSVELNKRVKGDSESIAGKDEIILRRSKRSCVLRISRQALPNATTARVRKNAKSTGLRKRPVLKNVPNPATTNANSAAQDMTTETPSVSISLPVESNYSLVEGSNSSLSKRLGNADDIDAEVQTASEPGPKMLCISSDGGESLSEAVDESVSNQINDPSTPDKRTIENAESVPEVSRVDIIMSDDAMVYRNRLQMAIAAKSFGRVIGRDTTPIELICGLRDAIECHKSLYLKMKILHGNISTDNILLTEPKRNHGCHGMLIGLDLAILQTNDKCSESSKTPAGTMEFMATRLLHNYINPTDGGVINTYQHDLASFFLVFISVCLRYGWASDKSAYPGLLRKWQQGRVVEMYYSKLRMISTFNFERNTLDAFSPSFEGLKEFATLLQRILFDGSDTIWPETYPYPEPLYHELLGPFDAEMERMKCES
ncbi:unnamed protein product [Blumeria hordei]|uniref:Fungal-type protein kinase domain-containing protein n=1 Tax=Blumeria hordei TaxID=2867405 RepID=A0A383V036_BLUHO|nr:unnamed protein product [Blumeria hordei]